MILFNEISHQTIVLCVMLLFFPSHRDMFTLNKSATKPKSATWKMGASGSLLMATIVCKTTKQVSDNTAVLAGFLLIFFNSTPQANKRGLRN